MMIKQGKDRTFFWDWKVSYTSKTLRSQINYILIILSIQFSITNNFIFKFLKFRCYFFPVVIDRLIGLGNYILSTAFVCTNYNNVEFSFIEHSRKGTVSISN